MNAWGGGGCSWRSLVDATMRNSQEFSTQPQEKELALNILLPKEAIPFPLISFSLFLTLEGLKLLPVRMGRHWGVGKHAHPNPFLSTVG